MCSRCVVAAQIVDQRPHYGVAQARLQRCCGHAAQQEAMSMLWQVQLPPKAPVKAVWQ